MSKRTYIFITLLLAVLLLRESGYLVLHWTHSDWNDRSDLNLIAEFRTAADDEKATLTRKTLTSSYDTDSQDKEWKASLTTSNPYNVFLEIEEQIVQNIEKDGRIKILVKEVHVDGSYWFPLFKGGSCSYQLFVQSAGQPPVLFSGTVDGRVEFTVVGFSSIADIKAKISRMVSKNAIENVLRAVKKA